MDAAIAFKIQKAVSDYERDNPAEFAAYKAQKKERQDAMKDDFAGVSGTHVTERELFTLPELLFNLIKMALTDEEHKQIWGQDPKCTGALWFARTYPQYRSGKRF